MMEVIYFTHAIATLLRSERLQCHLFKTLAEMWGISYQLDKETELAQRSYGYP